MNYFSRKDKIAVIQEQLSEFIASLKECCGNAEPAFISLGEKLQQIYADAEQLTRKTVEVISLMSGGESELEGILAQIESLVKNTLSELKNRQANVTANLSSSNLMIQHISDLYAICIVVEKVAMFLRIVGLNMDIESARSQEFTEMFGFVTREIRMLSEQALLTVTNIENNTRIAYSKQSEACQAIEKDLGALNELSNDAERAVKEAIKNIGAFTQLSVQAIEHTGQYSRIVSENIAEIVVTIQFHDSMNQRIDHVSKAIEDVQNLFKNAQSTKNKEIKAKSLGVAYAILGLQSNQLAYIASESKSFYKKGKSAFEHIGAEVATFTQSLSMLGGAEKESSEKPIAEITSALLCLYNLLGQGRLLLNRIRESTAHAAETTDRLSDYLRQIREFGFKTSLIALNAIIKASHLGEDGSTLEVLAQEMKKISDQTNTFAEDVEKILEKITLLTQELKLGSYDHSKNSGNARTSLETGIKNITETYHEFNTNAVEIFNNANNLKLSVENVANTDLLFFPKLSEQLEDHFQGLKYITQQLSHWAMEDIGELSEELDKLGERYTMKKERVIHQQTIQVSDTPENSSDDNIELF